MPILRDVRGAERLPAWALPQPGDPQPRLTIPPGDLRLEGGRVLRCVVRPFLAGAGSVDGAAWDEYPDREPRKGLRVIATLDVPPRAHGDQPLLHVSLSLPGSLPSWRQIKRVKDALYGPHVDAALILPRADDYVNVHPFAMQMWQLPWVWGVR